MILQELQAALVAAAEKAQSIAARVTARELTDEEKRQIDAHLAEVNRLKGEITRLEAVADLSKPQPRLVASPAEALASSVTPAIFASASDFFMAVRQAKPNHVDPRLVQAVSGGASEGTGADGGYAAPSELRRDIITAIYSPDTLQGLCDRLTTYSNTITVPVDEDPAWSATMAPQDLAEAAQASQQKPVFKQLTLTLAKKECFVPVTNELMEDTANIGAFVSRKIVEKLSYKLSAMVYAAMKGAPSKITQAKGSEGAGAAPAIGTVLNVWTKMGAPLRRNAVWVVNPAVETDMLTWVITGTQVPAYLPFDAPVQGVPGGRLLGRPVIFLEGAVAKGAEGDFMLVDPTSFFVVDKGGVRQDTSIHFLFDSDATVYRAIIRAAVASKFSAPITRADATTCSNVVTVQTR